MNNERDILIRALGPSLKRYEELTAGTTLLGRPNPDASILDPIVQAIEQCPSYLRVAGKMIYSAHAGFVIHAPRLAGDLFGRAQYKLPEAADWLLRILNTTTANGLFAAVIWGLRLENEIQVSSTSRLIPFSTLRKSTVKDRIEQRSRPTGYNAIWLTPTYYDEPGVALITEVRELPYISADGSPFTILESVTKGASEICSVLQAISVGHPLVIGYWFEYDDRDLDISAWDNSVRWLLPEVVPLIQSATPIDANVVRHELQQYAALPGDIQSDLLRSMDRFILSQCRRQPTDRVLDLALAFEIAVSGERSSAPISWKVSHRAAQLIGGPLEIRKSNRKIVADLYALRSKATHGSRLKDTDGNSGDGLRAAAEVYRTLLKSFLNSGRKPDWDTLELEPFSR